MGDSLDAGQMSHLLCCGEDVYGFVVSPIEVEVLQLTEIFKYMSIPFSCDASKPIITLYILQARAILQLYSYGYGYLSS
jgi:hypothetical protein